MAGSDPKGGDHAGLGGWRLPPPSRRPPRPGPGRTRRPAGWLEAVILYYIRCRCAPGGRNMSALNNRNDGLSERWRPYDRRIAREWPRPLDRRLSCAAGSERIFVVQRKPGRSAPGAPVAFPKFPMPASRDAAPVRLTVGARSVLAASSAALALAVSGLAAPVWAACTTSDTSGCGAAGGAGFPGRSGAGGAGNGQGGGSSHLDPSSVTVQDPGGWGAAGTGGAGAAGDAGAAPANGAALSLVGAATVVGAVTADTGSTGPDGTNFGSGGNGGNAGLYYQGSDISVSAAGTLTGGRGGNGGNAVNGVSGNGGGGGGGGSGMMTVGATTSISNSGTIVGGAGGNGGAAASAAAAGPAAMACWSWAATAPSRTLA